MKIQFEQERKPDLEFDPTFFEMKPVDFTSSSKK